MKYDVKITDKNALEYVDFLMQEYRAGNLLIFDKAAFEQSSGEINMGHIDYYIRLKPQGRSKDVSIIAKKNPESAQERYSIQMNNGIPNGWFRCSSNANSNVAKIFEKIRTIPEGQEMSIFRSFFEQAYMVLLKNKEKFDAKIFEAKIKRLAELWEKPEISDYKEGDTALLDDTNLRKEFRHILDAIVTFNREKKRKRPDFQNKQDLQMIHAKILFFIEKANKENIFSKTIYQKHANELQ